MKYGLILPALCAIGLAMPALAQPAGRDPNSSIATQGPSAHDAMTRAPSKPHQAHRSHPRKHTAMHARSARRGSADTTANDLNREELARLQQPMAASPSPPMAMPMPMEPNRALEGPKVSTGSRR